VTPRGVSAGEGLSGGAEFTDSPIVPCASRTSSPGLGDSLPFANPRFTESEAKAKCAVAACLSQKARCGNPSILTRAIREAERSVTQMIARPDPRVRAGDFRRRSAARELNSCGCGRVEPNGRTIAALSGPSALFRVARLPGSANRVAAICETSPSRTGFGLAGA
jgi:hypothetical protein